MELPRQFASSLPATGSTFQSAVVIPNQSSDCLCSGLWGLLRNAWSLRASHTESPFSLAGVARKHSALGAGFDLVLLDSPTKHCPYPRVTLSLPCRLGCPCSLERHPTHDPPLPSPSGGCSLCLITEDSFHPSYLSERCSGYSCWCQKQMHSCSFCTFQSSLNL